MVRGADPTPEANHVRSWTQHVDRVDELVGCHWLWQCAVSLRLSATSHWQSQWHTSHIFGWTGHQAHQATRAEADFCRTFPAWGVVWGLLS